MAKIKQTARKSTGTETAQFARKQQELVKKKLASKKSVNTTSNDSQQSVKIKPQSKHQHYKPVSRYVGIYKNCAFGFLFPHIY